MVNSWWLNVGSWNQTESGTETFKRHAGKSISTAKHAKYAKGKFCFGIVRVFRAGRGSIGGPPRAAWARHGCGVARKKMKPRLGRQIGKMSILTELEILGAGFLQRWRAYGAGTKIFLRQRAVLQATFIRAFFLAPVDDGRLVDRIAHRPVEQSVFLKVDVCLS